VGESKRIHKTTAETSRPGIASEFWDLPVMRADEFDSTVNLAVQAADRLVSQRIAADRYTHRLFMVSGNVQVVQFRRRNRERRTRP
jgi:hypothetical protein